MKREEKYLGMRKASKKELPDLIRILSESFDPDRMNVVDLHSIDPKNYRKGQHYEVYFYSIKYSI